MACTLSRRRLPKHCPEGPQRLAVAHLCAQAPFCLVNSRNTAGPRVGPGTRAWGCGEAGLPDNRGGSGWVGASKVGTGASQPVELTSFLRNKRLGCTSLWPALPLWPHLLLAFLPSLLGSSKPLLHTYLHRAKQGEVGKNLSSVLPESLKGL